MKIEDAFTGQNSLIHRIDPRQRLLFAVIWSFLIAPAKNLPAISVALVIAVYLVMLARLNMRIVFKRLTVVFGFLGMIWVLLPLTHEGEVFTQIKGVTLYYPGIMLSAQISLKSLTILMLFIVLAATIPVNTLANALYFFRLPE